MENQNELKRCPLCGETPYLNEIPPHSHMLPGLPDCDGECFVECKCSCSISAKDRKEAITKWNKRVDDLSSLPHFPYRLTQEEPDNYTSAMMNYAYAKDQRVVLRHANGKPDMDLCEFIAEAAKEHCGMSAESIEDGACIECNTDNCIYGICYTVAVQAAELRSRLAAYEDCFDMPVFSEYINKKG